jgi:hypothetical protein
MKEMKIATVRRDYLGGSVDECYLVENSADLRMYESLRVEHVRSAVIRAMRSPLPLHKFDHDIPSDTPYSGIMSMAWFRAKSKSANPIFEIEGAAMEGLSAMERAVDRGESLLVNKNGGWCTLVPSMMEVTGVRTGSLEGGLSPIKLASNSRWMALENDTALSTEAQAFLGKKDKKYSLITSLRDRSPDEVTSAIRTFVQLGGATVFAETTGADTEQMRALVAALTGLGVRRIVVRLTGELTDEVLDLKSVAEQQNVLVTILEKYTDS